MTSNPHPQLKLESLSAHNNMSTENATEVVDFKNMFQVVVTT